MASVAADTNATDAISELPTEGVVAATDGGRVIGLITIQQVATMLRRAQQFDALKPRRRTA